MEDLTLVKFLNYSAYWYCELMEDWYVFGPGLLALLISGFIGWKEGAWKNAVWVYWLGIKELIPEVYWMKLGYWE